MRLAVHVGESGPAAQLRWAVADTATMARRLIMVWRRRPSYLVFSVLQPTLLVLLLRYSIGGAVVVHAAGGYVNFLIPGAVAQAVIVIFGALGVRAYARLT